TARTGVSTRPSAKTRHASAATTEIRRSKLLRRVTPPTIPPRGWSWPAFKRCVAPESVGNAGFHIGAMLRAVRSVPGTLLVAVACVASCNDPRPPPLQEAPDGTDGSGGIDWNPTPCVGPPPPDGANYCGDEVVRVFTEKPVVYFVLDASGSMGDKFEDTGRSKLLSAKFAIRDLLLAIGHRISYGAAVFPDDKSGE